MISMVKLTTRKNEGARIREILKRKLSMPAGGLRSLRETQLRDALFRDKRGQRIFIPGEIRTLIKGMAEADYYIEYGSVQQKKRAIQLRKQYEEMYMDIGSTMHGRSARIAPISKEELKELRAVVRSEVLAEHEPKKKTRPQLGFKRFLEEQKKKH